MNWKIGILCAADTELEPFLEVMEHQTVSEQAMLRVYEGTLDGVPAVALFSGVCKVNAALAAQLLIDRYQVTGIINAGTAGGLDPAVKLFDTIVASRSVYHDVAEDILTEFHPWMPSIYFDSDPQWLAAAGRTVKSGRFSHPVRFGTMATGEYFVTQRGREEIRRKCGPLSVDMETAAVAHVCYVNQLPFLAVRTITDTQEAAGEEVFEQNCRQAAAIARDVTRAVLRELKSPMEHSKSGI